MSTTDFKGKEKNTPIHEINQFSYHEFVTDGLKNIDEIIICDSNSTAIDFPYEDCQDKIGLEPLPRALGGSFPGVEIKAAVTVAVT